MQRLLNSGWYKTVDEFLADVDQTWENCIQYHDDRNKELTDVAVQCREKFALEWARLSKPPKPKTAPAVTSPKVPKEKTPRKSNCLGCLQIVRRLKKMDTAKAFAAPVDLQAYPTYKDFVSEPMDLGTIESRLSNGEIIDSAEFERLVSLVFENCKKYNVEGSPVRILGDQMMAWLGPVLAASRGEGRLKSSLADILSKAAQKRSLKLEKERAREAKRNSKIAEKEQKRLEKQRQKELKAQARVQKQLEKESMPKRKSSLGVKRPRASSVAAAHESGPAKAVKTGKEMVDKQGKPPMPVLDESSLVRTCPPRPPLLRQQRDLLVDYFRKRSSHLMMQFVESSAVLDAEGQVDGDGKNWSAIIPSKVSKSRNSARPMVPNEMSKVRLQWKNKRRRPFLPLKQSKPSVNEMEIDENSLPSQAREWQHRALGWIKASREKNSNSDTSVEDALHQNYSFGGCALQYSLGMEESPIGDSSQKTLGFCRHSTAPLWLRAYHDVVKLEGHDGLDPVELDVYQISVLSERQHNASLSVHIKPLSGIMWQRLVSVQKGFLSVSLICLYPHLKSR